MGVRHDTGPLAGAAVARPEASQVTATRGAIDLYDPCPQDGVISRALGALPRRNPKRRGLHGVLWKRQGLLVQIARIQRARQIPDCSYCARRGAAWVGHGGTCDGAYSLAWPHIQSNAILYGRCSGATSDGGETPPKTKGA